MTRRELLLTTILTRTERPQMLACEIATGRALAENWPDAHQPFSAGSLMKPFVALAYGAEHAYRYPQVTCRHCWKPDGHGRLSLTGAIAFSCNTYFLDLAQNCSLDAVARVALTYGLPPPPDTPQNWMGLGAGWNVTPRTLLNAFIELTRRRSDPGPQAVLQGMLQAARTGTARALGLDAFAKTGTGPCTHVPKGQGDGYSVVVYPASNPQTALLLGLHNHPGSQAAREAGAWIQRLS